MHPVTTFRYFPRHIAYHVAHTPGKRRQRLARTLVLHRHVGEELAQVLDRLVMGAAGLEERAVGGEEQVERAGADVGGAVVDAIGKAVVRRSAGVGRV